MTSKQGEDVLDQRLREKPLLTVAEAACLAGLSRSVAYRWAEAGALPGIVRVGGRWYVRRRVLEAWLNGAGREGVTDAGAVAVPSRT